MFPTNPGDSFAFPFGKPISFLNVQEEDCVDFELNLTSVDSGNNVATVEVKHVPPKTACGIRLPAEWMRTPVSADNPNNIVAVSPQPDGTFDISVGSEIIYVKATVQLGTGKVLNATLSDQMKFIDRNCRDPRGESCKEPKTVKQQRDVSLTAL